MVKQWKRSLSGADVQVEAEDALEKDISQMDPASNSVAANLDGGVAAVDWSSKTPKFVFGSQSGSASAGDTVFSVNGSGIITGVVAYQQSDVNEVDHLGLEIDGNLVIDSPTISSREYPDNYVMYSSSTTHSFDSSFTVKNQVGNTFFSVSVNYVLD